MSRPQPQAWVSCALTLARSSRRGESLQQLTKMKSLLLVRKHAHTSLSEDQTVQSVCAQQSGTPEKVDSPEAQPGCPSRSEIYVINPGPPPLPEVLASEHPRPLRSGLCSLFLWLYPPPSGCPDLCAGRVRNLSVPLGDDAILIKGSDSPDLRLSLMLAVTLLCPEADRSPHRGTHVSLCHALHLDSPAACVTGCSPQTVSVFSRTSELLRKLLSGSVKPDWPHFFDYCRLQCL